MSARETDISVQRYRREIETTTPRIRRPAYKELRIGCALTRIRHRKRCALNTIRHRKRRRNARLRNSGNEYTQRCYYLIVSASLRKAGAQQTQICTAAIQYVRVESQALNGPVQSDHWQLRSSNRCSTMATSYLTTRQTLRPRSEERMRANRASVIVLFTPGLRHA